MTRDELILSRLDEVRVLAVRQRSKMRNSAIPLDDLIQYGMIGLIHAADRFKPERGLQFKTYADHKIRGAILDGIRTETRTKTIEGETYCTSLNVSQQLSSIPQASQFLLPDPVNAHAVVDARLTVDQLMREIPNKASARAAHIYREHEIEGWEAADLAKKHGLSKKTVWYYFFRARAELRAAAAA